MKALQRFPISAGALVFSVALSAVAIFYIGYLVPRQEFGTFLFWIGFAFLAYFLQMRAEIPLQQGLLISMGLRLVLLVTVPALSNDYFRFLWDGHLLHAGFNPYLTVPSHWIEAGKILPEGLSLDLYNSLNSPQYFTVYPPVCQAVFWLSTWVGDSVLASLVLMRVCLLVAEAGTLWVLPKVLKKLGHPPRLALWYALNPVIILELTGNLHFEAVMIFFLLSALLLVLEKKWVLSALVLGLAVGTKLLPLMLLPLLPRFLGWRMSFLFGTVVAVVLVVLFAPFMSTDLLSHMGNSLALYFQKFEFNASIYYVLRSLGYWLVGFNVISYVGAGLSLLTGVRAIISHH